MKKAVLFLLVSAMAAICQAEMVDDFDGYDISVSTNVIDLDTPWEARESSDLVDIIDDGTGNQVLSYGGAGFHNPTITEIPDTSVATTLFYRFYVNNEDIDNSFGLSDLTDNGWFSDFEIQIAVIRTGTTDDGVVNFHVRNSGSATQVATINAGQWYNVWAVIDQTTDTYDVYLGQGMLAATSANLVADSFSFRNGTADPLVAVKGLGYNSADSCLFIDDIYIIDGAYLGYAPTKPYDPAVSMESVGGQVEATLSWKPTVDDSGTYAVEPDIAEEYLFLGESVDAQYYIGTLPDPGTDEITVSEVVSGLDFDTKYYWTVVDATVGNEETFTVESTLADADPNVNIFGPTWSFDSLISSAVIDIQPSDTRVFEGETAVFTVEYNTAINPVVSADWYRNGVKLSEGDGITMDFSSAAGDGQATLAIAGASLDDEANYYCVLSTDSSVITDDVQTATRLLVIKKLLAQYSFDNSEDLLADTGEFAAEVGTARDAAQLKTVSLDDPNEMLAVAATPVEVDGIIGGALYLDGDKYVDMDSESYPRAGSLDTVGDIRGLGYEKQGFGRGMDAGSILLWIKPESDGCVIANASNTDGTHFAITTNGSNSARIIVRGDNWGSDSSWQNLGEASGAYDYMTDFDMLADGEWHMFAATWKDSTARIYINGEQVAESTQGYAEDYTAWDYSNLIGVSRQGQPNRHLLNAGDFFTGAVDELRIYNYAVSAEVIADEYEMLNEAGVVPCIDHEFVGNNANLDNTVNSYCVVDLFDLAVLAKYWLVDGFAVEDVE